MVAFCIMALGLLMATAADMNEPKPEHKEYFFDEWGAPHSITIPAIEGGTTTAEVGGWIIIFGLLSATGALLNQQLLSWQQQEEAQ